MSTLSHLLFMYVMFSFIIKKKDQGAGAVGEDWKYIYIYWRLLTNISKEAPWLQQVDDMTMSGSGDTHTHTPQIILKKKKKDAMFFA